MRVAESVSPPSRLETIATLKASNGDMAFATAFVTLTTGVFLVGFTQSVGGSAFWVNLLAALPSLCGILQIPGAIWGRSFPTYRSVIALGGWIWRLLYIPLIFLPILPIPDVAKLTILIACIGVGSAAVVAANPLYNDWLAELIPANSRGSFFSRRNAIGTAVGAGVGIIGALLLDAMKNGGMQNTGFSLIFGMASVCSGISFWFFFRMRDIPRENPVKANLISGLKAVEAPFRDPDYRRVLIFLGMAVVGQTFAGNLFAAFALQTLKLDYKVIQGTGVFHACGQVIAIRLWGFLSDKYGNKPVLVLLSFLMALSPIPWIYCHPGADTWNTVLLLSTHVLMGVVWSGTALCQFNIMLATAKPSDRGNYIAAGMTVSSLMGGIAPLLGASLFTELLAPLSDANAYKWVFFATVLLRLVAAVFLLPVKEEGASGVGQTMRVLGTMRPRGFMAMRDLARGTDMASREAAIQSVGEGRVGLASDEIIKALHDPTPRVRRQAAAALARLGDPRAVGELIHQLDEHPDLVEEETINALGDLGDAEAVRALIRTLQSPRSILRRAAARALGAIGSHEAAGPLMEAANKENDPDLRRSALQALRQMGAVEAEPAIVAAFRDPHPSVRIAAAEAVAELEITGAAPALRECLAAYQDEASAEVAYALGVAGEMSDIPQILGEATRAVSMITRRRCLLGVARLLGVEQQAYRLMLLEGMARDTALMELVKNGGKRNDWARPALEAFSNGSEQVALETLARRFADLRPLVDQPIDEAFLVGLLYGLLR